MHHSEITNEQLDDLLRVINEYYGYDFSGYAYASLKRRMLRCIGQAGLSNIYDLRFHLTNDEKFFAWFLESFTVNVTEMFRDPAFYKELREQIIPRLASYPIVKVWHAGCSTGEEVFSMAIMLKEAGLLDRARIYATDINPANLEKARKGIIPLNLMKQYTINYQQSGGTAEFSGYYSARYDQAIIAKELRTNIIFSQHNLVTDEVFNEFQLVCCRNVLIYFNRDLQNRVTNLFYNSLLPLGYLTLGTKESLMFTDVKSRFEIVNPNLKIYRRRL